MQLPNPGEILLGKYRVEEIIGIGGMGQVVKASHLYLQQPVAIKILLPEMVEHQSTIARFLREAQATVKLRSEHIARVMDVGTMPSGAPFMVMEFLEGYDLNQILRHHGPQMPQAVVDMILQACEGIAEAHAMGIVHRDIKPSNFFITRRPDGSNLLKILDFGISKTPTEISELTGTQTVIGTPTYMAPEQMVSARSTDPRSDIWSIGVVMYQLLAGRPPFEAETYAQLVLQVGTAPPAALHVPLPPGLQDIVFRCLEKDPGKRMQNVGELARMLAPYASDPVSAQQSAERSTRILTAPPRGSLQGIAMAGSAPGGLSMTPPTLTPKSWNKDGGSLTNSAGQIGTKVVHRGRGFVIAGVATLCILAGVGGFFIASAMKGDKHETKAAAEPPTTKSMASTTTMPVGGGSAAIAATGSGSAGSGSAAPAPTKPPPAPTKPITPTKTGSAAGSAAPTPTKTGSAAGSAAPTPTKTDATKPKPDTTKPDTTKPDKPDTTKTTHHSSSHTTKPKTDKPPDKPDKEKDLFDDRK